MDDIEKLAEKSITRTMIALDDMFSAAHELQGMSGIFHINMRVMQNLIYGAAIIIRSLRMSPELQLTEIEKVQKDHCAPQCSEDVLFVALLLACLNDTSGEEALDRAYRWYRKIMGKNYTDRLVDAFVDIGTSKH